MAPDIATCTPIPIKFTFNYNAPTDTRIDPATVNTNVKNTTNDLISDFVNDTGFMIYLFNGYIILEVDAKCLRYNKL